MEAKSPASAKFVSSANDEESDEDEDEEEDDEDEEFRDLGAVRTISPTF
jgi:hypothetical protein